MIFWNVNLWIVKILSWNNVMLFLSSKSDVRSNLKTGRCYSVLLKKPGLRVDTLQKAHVIQRLSLLLCVLNFFHWCIIFVGGITIIPMYNFLVIVGKLSATCLENHILVHDVIQNCISLPQKLLLTCLLLFWLCKKLYEHIQIFLPNLLLWACQYLF